MKLRKRRDRYNFFSGHSLQLAISFFFFRYFKKCRFTFVHKERKQKKLTFSRILSRINVVKKTITSCSCNDMLSGDAGI